MGYGNDSLILQPQDIIFHFDIFKDFIRKGVPFCILKFHTFFIHKP
jgi:hypothetical protein